MDYSTASAERRASHRATYALAKALYELKYGYGDNTLAEIMPLCTINDEMDLTRGWRA